MIKNENGKCLNIILGIFARLILTFIFIVVIVFATLKFLNIDLEVRYANGQLQLIKKQPEYVVKTIDDEYPNLADYNENSYFYNQLDDTAKAIYIGIKDNLNNMKTGKYKIDFKTRFNALLHQKDGQKKLSAAYQTAVDALKSDYPEIFYIDFSKVYLNTYSVTEGDRITYSVYIDKGNNSDYLIKGFTNEREVSRAINQIEGIKNAIIDAIPDNSSNFDKLMFVHDWLVDNLEYDETLERENRSNVYGALMERTVTCQGYAKAFKYIMDGLSVPCVLVKGDATNSENQTEKHIWNYVMINKKWYAIDVTWDDPIIVGNGTVSKEIKYKNFCKGKSFLNNHKENGLIEGTNKYFKYPELTQE